MTAVQPLERIMGLAREAGMKQVAADLEDEIRGIKQGHPAKIPNFKAGQPVWWFPSDVRRPDFMSRTQRMLAATVRTWNRDRGTVLIDYWDVTQTRLSFLVFASELIVREIPR